MRKTNLLPFLVVALLLASCSAGQSTPVIGPIAVPPTQKPAAPTATAAKAPEPAPLVGTSWQWVSFTDHNQKVAVDQPQNYTLSFKADGVLEIKADCNNAGAAYVLTDNQIQIDVGPMTLVACPEASLSEDFIRYLGFARLYFLKDGSLYMDLMADGGTMKFNPVK